MDDYTLFIGFVRHLLSLGFVQWRLVVNNQRGVGGLVLPAEGKSWAGMDDRVRIDWQIDEHQPTCLDIRVRRETDHGVRSFESTVYVTGVQQGIDAVAAVTGYGLEWTSGFRAGSAEAVGVIVDHGDMWSTSVLLGDDGRISEDLVLKAAMEHSVGWRHGGK